MQFGVRIKPTAVCQTQDSAPPNIKTEAPNAPTTVPSNDPPTAPQTP
jgi:hypothetical protein